MNREHFEFHKSVIGWLQDEGVVFDDAMIVIAHSIQSGMSVPESYVKFKYEMENAAIESSNPNGHA